MDIDISKNVSKVNAQIPSGKAVPKEVRTPHKNEEVTKNAEKMKQEVLSVKTVRMDYDADIDRVIITVVDSQSHEVVRQVPGADSITFMKRFQRVIKQTVNNKV
jgi:uncharacterized FlaG/YvyC family protein